MTRMVLYILLALGAACATPDDPVAPAPAQPRFTVTGVVYDSLASRLGPAPAPSGVHVSVDGVVGITDAEGRFTLTGVLGGTQVPFELLSLEYEPHTGTMRVDRDLTVSLSLRRLAPLITAFFPAGDSTRITVVDLQSRKTVERWQRTGVTLANGTTQWSQQGGQWIWNPIDIFTWTVLMPSTEGAEEFRFEIHDATGSVSQAICRVDSGCDHLAPIEDDPRE